MAYRHEWEVAQEVCSTGRGERPWHMCVSSALEGQRGAAGKQPAWKLQLVSRNMVKGGNGASVSEKKICL